MKTWTIKRGNRPNAKIALHQDGRYRIHDYYGMGMNPEPCRLVNGCPDGLKGFDTKEEAFAAYQQQQALLAMDNYNALAGI